MGTIPPQIINVIDRNYRRLLLADPVDRPELSLNRNSIPIVISVVDLLRLE